MSDRLAELLVAVELELDRELRAPAGPLISPNNLPLAAALGARLSAQAELELRNLSGFGSAPPGRHLALLSVHQVAERLDVKPETVRELYRKGQLAVVKVGRLVRFRPEDVDAWIARQTDGQRAT